MDTLLGALFVVTAVVTVAYWVDFFVRGTVHVVEEDWYIRFQRAFPAADGWTAACSLVAGIGLLTGSDVGTAFGLVAGGALVFLGLMDVLFNLRNGLYRLLPGSGAMWAEVVINVWVLGLGGLSVAYLAGRVA